MLQYLPTKLAPAEKGQLHVRPGRHPSPTRVLQHLRAHGPARGRLYGSYGRAEDVRALTHAHSLCGPRRSRRRCAGARALDAPLEGVGSGQASVQQEGTADLPALNPPRPVYRILFHITFKSYIIYSDIL